jgi:prepilin-type N-terminal cleavage/methylation domain-containing protein
MRTVRDAVASERGETLLELLVAVVIMSIALVAIVGGLVVSIHVSDIHRKQATAAALVRNYAEAFENAVTSGTFGSCADASGVAVPGLPAGFTPSVTSCGSEGDGLWLLEVKVSSSDGRASESIALRVRES